LSLFVAVAQTGTGNRVMTSPNGITWTIRTSAADNQWNSVCWSAELELFAAVSLNGTNRVMTSPNGITWTSRTIPNALPFSICWSPEIGLFVIVCIDSVGSGTRVITSSLIGRPPTSYNVFNSSFNNIDTAGNWTIKGKEFKTTDSNLLVETTSGDLELKCNSTGAGGQILLTGGTGLLSASAGGSASQHLVLTINGTQYKIALLNV
jgi:hypothetical protein